MMARCINTGGKILIFGNGGSAADAQHMAAEMVGRMLIDRSPLPAIALTTDTSCLTAIANDYGADQVFSRQVTALARPGDVVVAISTSGMSPNVLKGVDAARRKQCKIIGLTGGSGGWLGDACDVHLNVAATSISSRVQEVHIFAIHGMVDLMERYHLSRERGSMKR